MVFEGVQNSCKECSSYGFGLRNLVTSQPQIYKDYHFENNQDIKNCYNSTLPRVPSKALFLFVILFNIDNYYLALYIHMYISN